MSSIFSAFLIACFGLLALTACTGQPPVPDVRQGHAIVVERRPAELVLAPGPDGMMSVADIPRVKDFIDSWRDGGRGPLRVDLPERLGRGAQDRLHVTADQPMSTGMQPAAPPQTMFCDVRRLSPIV